MTDTASLDVVAHNELDAHDPEYGVDLARWCTLARNALATEGVPTGELNLLFVGIELMTELNEAHMDGTGPTDVLAFPIDGEGLAAGVDAVGSTPDASAEAGEALPLLLGDVVLCPAVARTNAAAHGCTFEDEMALLVVHGVLHVLGHDHAEPEETVRMKAREQALLDAHHR